MGIVCVIDNYDSFTYNLVQYLGELGAEVHVVRNDAATVDEVAAIRPERIVISPGPGRPEDAGITMNVIRALGERTPVLGVCLGHQAIGAVFGGQVVRAGVPMHGKTSIIEHNGRGVFNGMSELFEASRYHSLVVLEQGLPEALEVTARTRDDHIVMGLRHRRWPVHGVQFHPESIPDRRGSQAAPQFPGRAARLVWVSTGRRGAQRCTTAIARPRQRRGPLRCRKDGPVVMFPALMEKLTRHEDLTSDEAAAAMTEIMEGRAAPAQMAGLLMGLAMKGERPTEIVGLARAMRAHAVQISQRYERLFDTCGTGGDRSGTFNISSCAALVIAACGVGVAKHGNRSVSSLSGSADVFEALGVRVTASPAVVERCLAEAGVGFFFAPTFHPAMKHAGQTRRDLGVRTAFNLLGPLTNPAGATRQLVGVPRPELTELMARALMLLGSERAWVVHGADGIDEISTAGYTKVSEARDGTVNTFYLHPGDVGLPKASPAAFNGGDAHDNARIIERILAGERGATRDVVLLNAGAALLIAGVAASVEEGVALASRAIDRGDARRTLDTLIAVSTAEEFSGGAGA